MHIKYNFKRVQNIQFLEQNQLQLFAIIQVLEDMKFLKTFKQELELLFQNLQEQILFLRITLEWVIIKFNLNRNSKELLVNHKDLKK